MPFIESCCGVRHVQAVLMFFALVLAYGMRVNMSIAIVAMTDISDENSFDWSIQTQSVILSSFFWGYIILQVPGGELAARFGGSILITVCIAINAVVSMLIPLSAYYGGWQLVCACRVFQGLSQGFIVPSIHSLIGKWAPAEEKSRLGALVHAGSQLGNAIQLMAAGFIADYWGWPAIFYANGVLGGIWMIFYIFLGSDSPQKSKLIGDEERLYIQSSLGQVGEQKKLKTPWKAIWTSLPFISLIVVHCCQNWGFWTLMTEMPSYMKQVLGVDIKANGVMSALPYLAMYLLSFPFGFLTDYIPNKKWLSVTATRKLSNSIGLFGPAVALIGLSYTPAGNVLMAVALLTVVVGLNVGHITGLMLVHLDMAPNFAGTLLGITNCAANIISIIAPLAAGAVLNDETNPNEWRKVFYIASAVYIAGNTFYLIFGTSVRQRWNDPEDCDSNITDAEAKTTGEKVPYSPAGNVMVTVLLLTIMVGLNAGHYTEYLLVHIDMAPNFAGTMMGITNCFASIVSIITPLAAGAILKDGTNPGDWRKGFYLSSAVYIPCNTFFVIFGTSQRQQWNEPSDNTTSSTSQKNVEKNV